MIPFIAWHPNDMGLFSIGRDGQLNEWHLENSHQKYPIMDESNLGEHFDFVINDKGECDVYACSTETYIYHSKNERKEVNNFKDKDLTLEGKSYQIPPVEIIPAGNQINCIKFCSTGLLLLLGTGKKDSDLPGILRAYRYPLTGDVAEIQIHKRTITKIAVTADDSMIFTIGEDGVLAVIELSDSETRMAREKNLMNLPFASEYLYDKNIYVEKTLEIEDLSKKLKETQERSKRLNEKARKDKEEERNDLDMRLKKMREDEEDRMEKLEKETREMEEQFER